MIEVMSFGGGVQSTCIMVMACKGDIPMPDRWVFSDPGFETQATYEHIERCKEYLAKHGANLDLVTNGNIREDAVEFALWRDGSVKGRAASIPMFVRNNDGTDGILPRHCTSEYKIEPIEHYHREQLLGLKARQRAPKDVNVSVWIGISKDEERRASPPGRWKTTEIETGKDLFGEPITKQHREWVPVKWQRKVFPLLGYHLLPDRSKVTDERFEFCQDFDREDALNYLAKAWPHPVPRSACICCPYRGNGEWLQMKTEAPEEFAQAVEFDREIRKAYAEGQSARGRLAGVPYLHRTLIPLDQVDLTEKQNNRMGCGGLFDQEPDGICGV